MIAYLDRDPEPQGYSVVGGLHSFATDVPGERALVSAALTGRQVLFLASNPASVRCCLRKAAFTATWLDALIAAVNAPTPTTGARH